MKEDDDNFSQQDASSINRIRSPPIKSRTNLHPTKSFARIQDRTDRFYDNKSEISNATRNEYLYSEVNSSTSKTEPQISIKSREQISEKYKLVSKGASVKEGKIFSTPEFIVSDYWKTASNEIPVKLIELFKESNLEEKDSDVPLKKQKLSLEEEKEKLSYTKEFHVLTEVQKAKILTAIEDAIKKLANSDFNDCLYGKQGHRPENQSFVSENANMEKYFSKNFLLPWVIMKLLEMVGIFAFLTFEIDNFQKHRTIFGYFQIYPILVAFVCSRPKALVLCHITQMTFLSDDSYFQRKKEFLPVVVTYYFTLFIIVISLVIHISCYSYVGVQNPCYFMGVVSSSILALTTVLGIFILLFSMEYYKSFRAVLVLVFVGALFCTFIAELCICYIEVKNFWNRMEHTEQYYIP